MAIAARYLSRIQTLRQDNERFGLSMVLLSIPMSACIPVLGSVGSRMIDPVLFGAIVSLVGAFFLGIANLREIRDNWKRGIASEMMRLFGVGLFGTALANFLLFRGLSLTTGSNAAILLQVEPVYALLITTLFLGERPSRKQLLATALIITGAITVLCPGTFRVCKGDLLVLATPLFLVTANLLAQSCMRRGLSPQIVVTFRVFWGGILMTPFCLTGGSPLHIPWTSPLFVSSILGVALFGTGLSSLLWYMAISRVSLSRCTTIMSAYPVLAVVCSWVFLGESPQWTQIAGLVLVLTGIYGMCQRSGKTGHLVTRN